MCVSHRAAVTSWALCLRRFPMSPLPMLRHVPLEAAGYRSFIQLPILWGDQDAFRHVNNTLPIRWFECARIAYLEHSGVDEQLEQLQLGPISGLDHLQLSPATGLSRSSLGGGPNQPARGKQFHHGARDVQRFSGKRPWWPREVRSWSCSTIMPIDLAGCRMKSARELRHSKPLRQRIE
jgi:hypothetical protein